MFKRNSKIIIWNQRLMNKIWKKAHTLSRKAGAFYG